MDTLFTFLYSQDYVDGSYVRQDRVSHETSNTDFIFEFLRDFKTTNKVLTVLRTRNKNTL